MIKSIKTLVALLLISIAFTACVNTPVKGDEVLTKQIAFTSSTTNQRVVRTITIKRSEQERRDSIAREREDERVAYNSIMETLSSNDALTLSEYSEITQSSHAVLVYISGSWNGPCKMLEQSLISMKMDGTIAYTERLLRVDYEKSPEVEDHFEVTMVPIVKVYRGGKEVYSKNGYHTREQIKEALLK